MPLRDTKYKRNLSILKVYGVGEHRKIKVVTMFSVRNAGVDCDFKSSAPGSVNDDKLENNVARARSKIFELAFCNPWDYFFTGTLDSQKYDRQDLAKFHSDITDFLWKQTDDGIPFLLIPELHKDGKSWHMHGFLSGVPSDALHRFQIGDHMGKALAEKVVAGDPVFNWPAYADKFGFCDLEPIRSPEAVSKYVRKYISKDLAGSVTASGAHLYYHSRGLLGAQTIKKGTMLADIVPTYQNDYCRVAWLPYSDELLQSLSESFVR